MIKKANQLELTDKLQIILTTHYQIFSLYFHEILLRIFQSFILLCLKETFLLLYLLQ